mgnify:CR=1 FL=1
MRGIRSQEMVNFLEGVICIVPHIEKQLRQEFEEKCLEFFQSEDFFKILRAEVRNYFKYPWEIETKLSHYENIHRLWIQSEREKLFSSSQSS